MKGKDLNAAASEEWRVMGSEVVSKLAVSGCSDFDFALLLLGLRTGTVGRSKG
jgi:hypothetical protein